MKRNCTDYIILLISCLIAFISSGTTTLPSLKNNINLDTDNSQFTFRENKGQWDGHILYRLDIGFAQIYAEKGRLTWALHDVDDLDKRADYFHSGDEHSLHENQETPIVRSHAFRMNFLGSNIEHGHLGEAPGTSYSNYFIGNNPDNWASHVLDYKRITYTSLYEGIDLVLGQNQQYLKYDFIVEPGADPGQIKVEYEGVEELNLVGGNLYVVTSVNEIKEVKPYAYQEIDGRRIAVPCEFHIEDNVLTYHLPKGYNKSYELVIDPTLIFSSYSGSSADNWGMTATPGPNGELYGGGVVFGPNYPTTTGAYDSSYNGMGTSTTDIGITKYSADGSQALYATYIGGSASDIPHSMIVNNNGQLVIMGSSSSQNYPTSSGAYDRTHNGGYGYRDINGIGVRGTDIVLSILTPDGDALVASTFIGGKGEDGGAYNENRLVKNYSDQLRGEVVVDDNDNVYVASLTNSSDFPIKSGFQQSFGGNFDGVVFSMDSNLSQLRWSSFIGGKGEDAAYSIKVDNNGNVIVGGGTMSEDLLNISSGVQPDFNGYVDGYLIKISADGTTLLGGTYVGTDFYDQVYLVETDAENNIFAYGQSEGKMPVSSGVYYNQDGGMFIQKYSPNLSTRLLATTIGSGNNIANISPSAFLVDDCERIYISGWGGIVNERYYMSSTTNGLPTTQNALQSTTDGSDFYFLVLEKDATELLYASFFGADLGNQRAGQEHVDGGTSRFSKEGVIYQAVCAGCAGTNKFPTTEGSAYPDLGSSNCNLGVFKMAFNLDEIKAAADVEPDLMGCAPYTVNLKNNSTGTNKYNWDFGDGNSSSDYQPTHTFTQPGNYKIQLIALSGNPCLEPDTAYLNITVEEPPEDSFETYVFCNDTTITINSRINDNNADYTWNTGQSTQSIDVSKTGTYIVHADYQNCIYTDSFEIIYAMPQTRIEDEVVCDTGALTLIVDSEAQDIVWSTGQTAQSIEITEDGEYWVSYTILDCPFADTASIFFPDLPHVNLSGDSLACEGEEIYLEVENSGPATIESYQWSNGTIGESTIISESGIYTVTGITSEGCTDTDSIDAFFIPLQPELNLPDSTVIICSDNTFTIDLSDYDIPGTEIKWNDGVNEFTRELDRTGTYTVNIVNQCQELFDDLVLKQSDFKATDFPVYIPNAFTPNDDGLNDEFRPLFHPDVHINSYELEIYNRWGDRVFRSLDPNLSWNGSFKEKKMDPGIFMWTLEVNYLICEDAQGRFRKGNVSILK